METFHVNVAQRIDRCVVVTVQRFDGDRWIGRNIVQVIQSQPCHGSDIAGQYQAVLFQPLTQIGGRVVGIDPPLKAEVALAMKREGFFDAPIGLVRCPVNAAHAVAARMRIAETPATAVQPEAAAGVGRNPFAHIVAVARRSKHLQQFVIAQRGGRDPAFAPRAGDGFGAVQIDDAGSDRP